MTRQQKDNSGVLFVNHHRSTDRHPSMKGSCRVDGFDYWISAWAKSSDDGGKFLSLAFKSKDKETLQQKIDKESP